jgi:hypothetical protein
MDDEIDPQQIAHEHYMKAIQHEATIAAIILDISEIQLAQIDHQLRVLVHTATARWTEPLDADDLNRIWRMLLYRLLMKGESYGKRDS